MKYPDDFINKILCGDCLEEHNKIKSGSVDLILTDLPYGTISGAGLDGWENNKIDWDIAIEPKQIYEIANRILRKNGKMVLFSQEPYTTQLITEAISNIPFNYRIIWEKDHFANSLIAKKAPVSYFEDILVFSKKYDLEALHPLRPYFEKVMDFIGLSLKQINIKLGHRKAEHTFYIYSTQFSLCTEPIYNELIAVFSIDKMKGFKTYSEISQESDGFLNTFNLWEGKKYKSNILKYKKDYDGYHPTQKPVLLLEDLIKTFVACINTKRNYILIEKKKKHYEFAKRRIKAIPGTLF